MRRVALCVLALLVLVGAADVKPGPAIGVATGRIPDTALLPRSASSLGSKGEWCTVVTDKQQWLQIDLGANPVPVAFVSVKGDVTTYIIEAADVAEGDRFQPLLDQATGDEKDLPAGSIVALKSPITRRFIRIIPIAWKNRLCTSEIELYAPAGTSSPLPAYKPVVEVGPELGMGSRRIPDDAISASDNYIEDTCFPKHARVGGSAAWCEKSNTKGEKPSWLQIDLGVPTKIAGVGTMGRKGKKQWVTKYMVRVSNDAEDWTYVTGADKSAPAELRGNYNENSLHIASFVNGPVEARYIRIEPINWQSWPSMRVELYGAIGAQAPGAYSRPKVIGDSLGVGTGGRVPKDAFLASTTFASPDCAPYNGRLNLVSQSASLGWCAATVIPANGAVDWLQVDLGQTTEIAGYAIEGRSKMDQYVTAFEFGFADDDAENSFRWFKEPLAGVFQRNDQNKQPLPRVIKARYVRIKPLSFHGFPCLRFDLFAPIGAKAPGAYVRDPIVGPALGVESYRIPDDSILASTSIPGALTSPWDGRLDKIRERTETTGEREYGWCAGSANQKQWLLVDLGEATPVGGVALQGRHKVNNYVTRVKVSFAESQKDFVAGNFVPMDSLEVDHNGFIIANADSDTVRTVASRKPFTARYVRFQPVAWVGNTPCMRVEVYAPVGAKEPKEYIRPKDMGPAVGMSSGRIPADAISASSTFPDKNCASKNARLNLSKDKSAWCANVAAVGQYLQIDLGVVSPVAGIATQGRFGVDQWVTSYRVATSGDGHEWSVIRDEAKSDRVFDANHDSDTPRYNTFGEVLCRFVRIYPLTWHMHPSMRVEIYLTLNAQLNPVYERRIALGPALGMQNNYIPDFAITASSFREFENAGLAPWRARLNSNRGAGAWCAATNDKKQWLQVDLGVQNGTYVAGIGLQGRDLDAKLSKNSPGYITVFTVEHSIDGKQWTTITDKAGTTVVFQGKDDTSDEERRNEFAHPILARYIRILPQGWVGGVCARVEIYGAFGAAAALTQDNMEQIPPHAIDGGKFNFRDDRNGPPIGNDSPPLVNPFALPSIRSKSHQVLQANGINTVAETGAAPAAPWSYSNQQQWGDLNPNWKQCTTGKRQSPINLRDDTSLLQKLPNDVAMKLGYSTVTNRTFVDMNNVRYYYDAMVWHTPAEHTVDGVQAPAELHLKFRSLNTMTSDPDDLVLSVLFSLGKQGLPRLAPIGGNAESLLPQGNERANYFAYKGSLTMPPCSSATVFVFRNLLQITPDQLEALKKVPTTVGARDIQALNDRKVYDSQMK